MNPQPRILLLCSARIAIPALRLLAQEGVLACTAVPDRHAEITSLFRETVAALGSPFRLLTYKTFRSEIASLLEEYRPDAVLVIGFPWKLPVSEWSQVPYGFLNFHAGLLPEMRGPDPMFECIRRSVPETGMTLHRMDEAFDSGPIVFRETLPLIAGTTHGILSGQMAAKAHDFCARLLALMREGSPLSETEQQEADAGYWSPIRPEELCISWEDMSAQEIRSLINACNPSLKGAITAINGWNIRVLDAIDIDLTGDTSALQPGAVLYIDAQYGLIVFCKGGRGLKIEVVSVEEGVLPGYKLAYFGVAQGMKFMDLPVQVATA